MFEAVSRTQPLTVEKQVICTYCTDGIFRGGLIFVFSVTEKIRENYIHVSLPCMHMRVHGAGAHLRCMNINLRISSVMTVTQKFTTAKNTRVLKWEILHK